MHDNGGVAVDRTQEDGGWDYEFLVAPPDEYICSICLKTLRDPKQIANCGHRFCAVCLSPILRNQNAQCPLDRDEIERERVFQDNACNRKILAFAVKCLNHRQGCDWTGELRDGEAHRQTCPKEEMKCRNSHCQQSVTREQITHHEKIECEWRIVSCEHCSDQHPVCRAAEHLLSCRKLPIDCVNSCGKKRIPREEMEDHLVKYCPKAMVKCEYADLGCSTLIIRENLDVHMESQVRQHLGLACRKLAATELKLTEVFHRLESRNKEMEDIESRLSQLERAPNKEDGKLLWKIDNYDERLQACKNKKAPHVYSDPFFSGRYGYKMRASVSLNGDGDGEGTHLSIYIIIMKGKYDALLPWPFKQNVTFYLLDQSEDYSTRQDWKMEYRPDPTLDGYHRPQTDRNQGVGIWKFLSHDLISEGRRFLSDDAIFIKVEIEPFDLLGESG